MAPGPWSPRRRSRAKVLSARVKGSCPTSPLPPDSPPFLSLFPSFSFFTSPAWRYSNDKVRPCGLGVLLLTLRGGGGGGGGGGGAPASPRPQRGLPFTLRTWLQRTTAKNSTPTKKRPLVMETRQPAGTCAVTGRINLYQPVRSQRKTVPEGTPSSSRILCQAKRFFV